MADRSYEGDPLDHTWQDLKDRPYKGSGETISATDKEDKGSESTTGVPSLDAPESVERHKEALITLAKHGQTDLAKDAKDLLVDAYGPTVLK